MRFVRMALLVGALVLAGIVGLLAGTALHVDQPQVQAAIIGVGGALTVALVGAGAVYLSARVAEGTARHTREDAAAARAEARTDAQAARRQDREDAQRGKFLDERRSVIVDVLMAGERAVAIALDRGRRGPKAVDEPLPV